MLAILSSLSCEADPQAAAQARMRNWRAKDFFKDLRDAKLAEAVTRGDKAAIDTLVSEGADVNARGKQGTPLLLWAMAKESVVGFKALLEHGADLKALINDPEHTKNGERTRQVIELVVSAFNPEFLRVCLKHGFDPDYVPYPKMNESLLFRAIWTHAIKNVEILLDAGADINHLDGNRSPPIELAMGIRDYEVVLFLLSRGADPCIKVDGYDLPGLMKQYGIRGVSDKQLPYFHKVVAELKKRNLITDVDIENANNSIPFSNRQPQQDGAGNP
jgi:ankyrin repeat protein